MATLSAEITVIQTVSEIPLRPIMTLMATGKDRLTAILRQFGIRLEQRELIGVLNTIPLNSLRFVVEETICTKCSDEVHQEIVDRPVSGVYKVSFVL